MNFDINHNATVLQMETDERFVLVFMPAARKIHHLKLFFLIWKLRNVNGWLIMVSSRTWCRIVIS